jgi:hypothetical protein
MNILPFIGVQGPHPAGVKQREEDEVCPSAGEDVRFFHFALHDTAN